MLLPAYHQHLALVTQRTISPCKMQVRDCNGPNNDKYICTRSFFFLIFEITRSFRKQCKLIRVFFSFASFTVLTNRRQQNGRGYPRLAVRAMGGPETHRSRCDMCFGFPRKCRRNLNTSHHPACREVALEFSMTQRA